MTFHPADHMVTLFNPIERLKKLAVSTKIPYAELKILDIGLTVIQKTGDFERALGEWAIKPPGFAKTWTAFQDHFRKAQKAL